MLSYNQLIKLYENGVLYNLASPNQVQGSSIDVRLGRLVMVEKAGNHKIVLKDRDAMKMESLDITDNGFDLAPGEFILAHTEEMFNMPDNLSATFHLKSTSARSGLGHLLAVHIDPGFYGSSLTLEIHNVSRFHTVELNRYDFIGQIMFWQHEEVPAHASYRSRGHYNNDAVVSGVKK